MEKGEYSYYRYMMETEPDFEKGRKFPAISPKVMALVVALSLPNSVSKSIPNKVFEVIKERTKAENIVHVYSALYSKISPNHKVFVTDDYEMIGAPIPIDTLYLDESNFIAPRAKYSTSIRQKWYDSARTLLKEEYPDRDEIDPKNQKPRVMGFDLVKQRGDETLAERFNEPTFVDQVIAQSQECVNSGMDICLSDYIAEEFAKTSIPKDLQEMILFGQFPIESGLDNSMVSNKGAKSIVQLMKSRCRTIGISPRDLDDITKTIPAVAKDFERIYEDFSAMPEMICLLEETGFTKENFLYPMVIVQWFYGTAGTKRHIKWVYENQIWKQISSFKGLDPTFEVLEKIRDRSEKDYFSNASFEYFFKVYAMYQSMKERIQ